MQPTVPDVEAVPRRSRHQDAEQIEARDALLRAAGVETRVLPLVTGTGKPVEIDPHARDCGPSPLSEEALASICSPRMARRQRLSLSLPSSLISSKRAPLHGSFMRTWHRQMPPRR